jgi:putative glycosyltransferase
MYLSVVSTLYNSEPYVREFYQRVSAAAQRVTAEYELILVDDGSPDHSLDVALSLFEQDPRVRVIELSRNFGHHRAIMTGLAHSRGNLVFLCDSDLEEPPEILEGFHEELQRSGADVVYGVQALRRGRFVERLTGQLFYWLFNRLASYPVPRNLATVRLMSRRYVTALVQHRERELFLGGILAITGFTQRPVVIGKSHKGRSSYTLSRRVSLAVNSLTAFSSKPLYYVFNLGCVISALSALVASFFVGRRLFSGHLLPGWASLIVSVWFLGGLIIFCLGVIGIYLSKIFTEIKQRPYTVIAQVHERDP